MTPQQAITILREHYPEGYISISAEVDSHHGNKARAEIRVWIGQLKRDFKAVSLQQAVGMALDEEDDSAGIDSAAEIFAAAEAMHPAPSIPNIFDATNAVIVATSQLHAAQSSDSPFTLPSEQNAVTQVSQ